MKKKTPSVFAVSGGQDLLRKRFLQQVITDQEKEGWKVEYVDGTELAEVFGQTGSVFDFEGVSSEDKLIFVVTNPNKADLDLLKEHAVKSDQDKVIILNIEGEPDGRTKFGQFVKTLQTHSNHPKPQFWDEVDVAAKFCVTEASLHNKTLDAALAAEMARKISTDLGFLAFEIQKMAILADLDDSKAIQVKHVLGGRAMIAQAIIAPMTDALADRNQKALIKALFQIHKGSKGDPTMRVTALLWNTFSKWLGITEMLEQGVGSDDASSRLKINPWYYKNKLLPQVQHWTRADVVKLIQVLAEAERAVLNGQLNPWAKLTTGLLGVCGSSR